MIELTLMKGLIWKKCDICHYCYFFKYVYVLEVFMFQPYVCNGSHDILMMSMNLSDITILNINGADYCCIIIGISETKIINLM